MQLHPLLQQQQTVARLNVYTARCLQQATVNSDEFAVYERRKSAACYPLTAEGARPSCC